ncbi:unnamed protein product [Clonostachys rhizophaga]|uniref:Uncharacterized protein n=1 Tax=Clonostachys rhizophaga TaxID=160324 RepID=A0A9N9VEA2_9HYPO|nr:unnamed protein product [Clonostachys rhizophaga]
MRGDTSSAFFHHFRAAQHLLERRQVSWPSYSNCGFSFALEVHLYLAVIAQITPGALGEARLIRCDEEMFSFLPLVAPSNLNLLVPGSQTLFKLIPRVTTTAQKASRQGRFDHLAIGCMLSDILAWKPPIGRRKEDEISNAVAIMYRQALVMYLVLLHNGNVSHESMADKRMSDAQSVFWQHLRMILWNSPVHTISVRPLLVAGSFFGRHADQQALLQFLTEQHSRFYVLLPLTIGRLLRLLWSSSDLYGPFGLEQVMLMHNINIGIA